MKILLLLFATIPAVFGQAPTPLRIYKHSSGSPTPAVLQLETADTPAKIVSVVAPATLGANITINLQSASQTLAGIDINNTFTGTQTFNNVTLGAAGLLRVPSQAHFGNCGTPATGPIDVLYLCEPSSSYMALHVDGRNLYERQGKQLSLNPNYALTDTEARLYTLQSMGLWFGVNQSGTAHWPIQLDSDGTIRFDEHMKPTNDGATDLGVDGFAIRTVTARTLNIDHAGETGVHRVQISNGGGANGSPTVSGTIATAMGDGSFVAKLDAAGFLTNRGYRIGSPGSETTVIDSSRNAAFVGLTTSATATFSGNLVVGADNTYTLGGVGARLQRVYTMGWSTYGSNFVTSGSSITVQSGGSMNLSSGSTWNAFNGGLGKVWTSDAGGNGAWQTTSAAGVTSLNSLSGALSIAAGTAITVTPSGANITIANVGVTSLTATGPLARDVSTGAVTISCTNCSDKTATETLSGAKTFSAGASWTTGSGSRTQIGLGTVTLDYNGTNRVQASNGGPGGAGSLITNDNGGTAVNTLNSSGITTTAQLQGSTLYLTSMAGGSGYEFACVSRTDGAIVRSVISCDLI